jgi:hypothetical protein
VLKKKGQEEHESIGSGDCFVGLAVGKAGGSERERPQTGGVECIVWWSVNLSSMEENAISLPFCGISSNPT